MVWFSFCLGRRALLGFDSHERSVGLSFSRWRDGGVGGDRCNHLL